MKRLHAEVMVLGAGAVGTSIATTLQMSGCQTLQAGVRGPSNASSVAAGMIAPWLEHRTDPGAATSFHLLAAGADLWPDFAAATGVALRSAGALWLSPEAVGPRVMAAGRTLEPITLSQAHAVQPRLGPWSGPISFAPEEACVDPRQALQAMDAAFSAKGGRAVRGQASWDGRQWWVDDQAISVGTVILATGFEGQGLAAHVPELQVLRPIRGQIVRVAAGLDPVSPCVRGPGAYVAPQADGSAMVGATMEVGEDSPRPDPQMAVELVAAAARFMPHLANCRIEALAGIRAGTPDHLPLVGRSSTSGVWLATGLRRNGWLLAPLVASLIRDYLAGHDPGAHARALDPARFERAG